jgi:hypothetical protein
VQDFNYLVGDEKDYKDEATQAKFKQVRRAHTGTRGVL